MRDKIIQTLLPALRNKGYHDLTLSYISEITSLNKSSLYHYFPGGKAEIASAILSFVHSSLSEELKKINDQECSYAKKFEMTLDVLAEFYNNGQNSCFIDIMSINVPNETIKNMVSNILDTLVIFFKNIFMNCYQNESKSEKEAINLITLLQGSLILSRAWNNPTIFIDQINKLKKINLTTC